MTRKQPAVRWQRGRVFQLCVTFHRHLQPVGRFVFKPALQSGTSDARASEDEICVHVIEQGSSARAETCAGRKSRSIFGSLIKCFDEPFYTPSSLSLIPSQAGVAWYIPPPSSLTPCHPLPLTKWYQAHRIITQVFLTGARVFGRAFAEAYKQASASQKYASAMRDNPTAANSMSASGLTLDEACRILNVSPPKGGEADLGRVHEQFKRLFDMNDPKKGGSFYLQSKVLRARERIELEVRRAEGRRQREEELGRGWKPRVYRDR